MFDLRSIVSSSLVLFAVLDIIGSLPIVLDMKEQGLRVPPLQTVLLAGALLIAFMFIGEGMLEVFGVDLGSFAVAGAIVLFLIGLEMVMGVDLIKTSDGPKASALVPLAFPLLAGPGTFTAVLSLRAQYDPISVLIAIILNMAFVYIVLRLADSINRVLGASVIYILKKIFGVLLLAIAIKLFTSNVASLFGQ